MLFKDIKINVLNLILFYIVLIWWTEERNVNVISAILFAKEILGSYNNRECAWKVCLGLSVQRQKKCILINQQILYVYFKEDVLTIRNKNKK